MTDKIYTIKELNTLDYQNTDLKIGDTIVARASMVKMWEYYPDRPDQPQMILQDPKQIIEQEALSAPGNQESYKAYCNSALPVWLGALQPAPWLQYLGNQPIDNIVTQCWTLRLESKSKVAPPRWVLDTTEAATGPSFFTAPEPIFVPLEAAMWNTQLNWVPMLVTGNVVEVYESFNALTLEKRVMLGDSISSYRMNIILNVDPYTPVEWLPGLIGMNAKSVPIIPQLWSGEDTASVGTSDDLSYFRTAGLIKEHTYDMHMPEIVLPELTTLPVDGKNNNDGKNNEADDEMSSGDLSPNTPVDSFEPGEPQVIEGTAESSQDSVPPVDDIDEDHPNEPSEGCLLTYYREKALAHKQLEEKVKELECRISSMCETSLARENEELKKKLYLAEQKMENDSIKSLPPRTKERLEKQKRQKTLEEVYLKEQQERQSEAQMMDDILREEEEVIANAEDS